MNDFSFRLMVLLHLQIGILLDVCYAGVTNFTVPEGNNVTLQLDKEGQKRDITWVTAGGNHFATTKPNEDIVIRDTRYTGRLHALKDGSLFMIQLKMEDQGMYRANIRLVNGSTGGHNFNLFVTEPNPPNGASSRHSSQYNLSWMFLGWLIGGAAHTVIR
ncbi:unnamed protein product [Staurois parvus]|uniref:Immunoglobulin V-set domain-containing protein n=1 Tax=Staurois parvus TaxID=386267 RepID=A0ABN9B7B1_9NEOB|nr:unnamed protein product [Staurois parvus]